MTSARETGGDFDRDSWERRWSQALREGAHTIVKRPRTRTCSARSPTCVPAALEHARSRADGLGADVAARIEWIAADLATWIPPPERYDLVACLYVHVAGSVAALERQLAAGVAAGGRLLLVGHRPIDPTTGEPTAAAGQVQVSVDSALGALELDRWEVVVAEDRPRQAAGSGVDAVVHARRLA